MGNCFSCFKTNQNSNEQHQYQIKPRVAGLHIIQHPDVESLSEAGSGHCIDRSPVVTLDCQHSNGSGNKNVAPGMPDKRSFYSRIPPLSKSMGCGAAEGRRAPARQECSDAKIATLFDHYKDPSCDIMLADGIVRLCADLDVTPEDLRVLVFAWKCDAAAMCQFTRAEFHAGCLAARADTARLLQQRLPDLLAEARRPDQFKELYRFTFRFGLDADCGQRVLPTDVAVVLWRLVFSLQEEPPVTPVLGKWFDFLENHPGVRGIPKDTWYMFLKFVETVDADFGSYDDNAAWPSLFDDFVEYENDQLNQNISKDQKRQNSH